MNSSLFKKIGLVLLALLFLLQFVQPARNEGQSSGPNDVTQAMNVPVSVQQTLEKSCYDCHSNHTEYPWYSNIQPLGFWLKDHVDEGKEELNFSEFNSYTPKRKAKKMKEIVKEIEEGEMPLSSYTLIHGDAKLTEAQKAELIAWAKANQQFVPTDSVVVASAERGEEKYESQKEH
jgi:hypothetical protein